MISKLDLQVVLKHASEACGLPLSLELWAPGDGWTRYRVKHGEGASYVESVYFTRSECYAFLQGMVACKGWAPRVARMIDYAKENAT